MRPALFDLGLCAADLDALREASRSGFRLDREAAFRLVAQASARVDAAVRRRPLFSGAPFELPGPGEAGPGTTDPKGSGFRDPS